MSGEKNCKVCIVSEAIKQAIRRHQFDDHQLYCMGEDDSDEHLTLAAEILQALAEAEKNDRR